MSTSVFLIAMLGIILGLLSLGIVIYFYRTILVCRRYLNGQIVEISTKTVEFKKELHAHTSSQTIGAGTTQERQVGGTTTYSYSYHIYYSFCDYHGAKKYIARFVSKYCEPVLSADVQSLCLEYIGNSFYFGPFEIKEDISKSLYSQYTRGNSILSIPIRYDSKYPVNCNIVDNECLLYIICVYGFGFVCSLAVFLWIFVLLESVLTNMMILVLMIFVLITLITSICLCIKKKHSCIQCFTGWFDRYYFNNNSLFQLQCNTYSDDDESSSWDSDDSDANALSLRPKPRNRHKYVLRIYKLHENY